MDALRAVRERRGSLLFLLVMAFAVVLLRNAWIGDDAYITLRTVDNFVHGHGLRWNVAERVQAYTHPLWMFLLSAFYAFTHDDYFTTLWLNVALSLAAFGLVLFRVSVNGRAAFVAATAMILSKAFMDYSTSGLENPLTHLLLALFVMVFFAERRDARNFGVLCLLIGLVALNRIDLLPLFFPAFLLRAWPFLAGSSRRSLLAKADGREGVRKGAGALLLGFLPLIAWELFSLFYYGFPFPNTAYAKLNTGVERSDLVEQGFLYLVDSFRADPVTLIVVGWALLVALARGDRNEKALAGGIALFLVYLVVIGGDFMTGRFLTPVFFLAVLMLSRRAVEIEEAVLASVVLLVMGLTSPQNPVMSGENYTDTPNRSFMIHNGIADERGFFYPFTGLLKYERGKPDLPTYPHRYAGWEAKQRAEKEGPFAMIHPDGTVGFFGHEAGPKVHIVDMFCLADPLLARMKSIGAYTGKWRIGHFTRYIPSGYLETLQAGTNVIVDPGVAAYYDKLSFVIRGPLFSPRRWVEAVKMNLGAYRHLLDHRLTFRWRDCAHHTGGVIQVPGSRSESVLAAKPGENREGFLVCGNYGHLPRGAYVARFRLKTAAGAAGDVARIDATAHSGRIVFAERTLAGGDFPADGSWAVFELPFDVEPKRAEDTEFRVYFTGAAELAVDEVAVAPRVAPD